MKKELIIYAGLLVMSCALFSFEFMVKNNTQNLSVSTYKAPGINSISFDVPANVFFIQGEVNKIILEGTQTSLNGIELNNSLGNFELKKKKSPVLHSFMQTFISKNQTVNMYVIAENIEYINVINQNGCLVKNVIFNGDRGILEVEDSDIIQFASAKTTDFYYQHTSRKIELKAPSLTSCL